MRPLHRLALGLILSIAFATLSSRPALAQSAAPPAAEDKAALVQRLLQLWHVEDKALSMVQRPALDALQQARIALQGRVSAQKQEATLKDMGADIQRYLEETLPVVRRNADRLKPEIIGPLLVQHFSADELRQLILLLESPVKKKFEQLIPQMEQAFGEKLADQSRPSVDPKLQALQQAVGMKLRAAVIAP